MALIGLESTKTRRLVEVDSAAIKTLGALKDGGTDIELANGTHIQVREPVPQIQALISTPYLPAKKRFRS